LFTESMRKSFGILALGVLKGAHAFSPTVVPAFSRHTQRANTSLVQRRMFGSLFGGGGAAGQKIVYDNLKGAAKEMGKLALAGEIAEKSEKGYNIATFAGGCFWGLELAYQRVPGVVETAVGYCQGPEPEPTYGQVCSGSTGHTEAIQVYYDDTCTYEDLLNTFFDRVDPTTVNGQGNDRGTQYRTGVYPHSDAQMEVAKARFEVEKGNYRRSIASELEKVGVFWPAEDYHQQYLEKGGRMGTAQSAEKGCKDTIRCYG
jgi:peptide-methionine (S)-S-oxide reductase